MSIAYDNVKAKYQKIARANEMLLEKRKEAVYKKLPEIKKIEAEISRLNLDELKVAIVSDDSKKAREKIDASRDKLADEKRTLLKKAGYSEGYLDPIYTCQKCKDTGYTDPQTKCECFNRYLLEERTKDSGLRENSGRFESFDERVFSENKKNEKTSQRQFMSGLKKRAEDFALSVPKSDIKNFIIMGSAGTGKSFLVEAIINGVLKRGYVCEYYTASRLFSLFYNHRLGENVDLELLMELPLLAIDDLGTEIMTKNVTIEYFYNLISERESRGGFTVIATNLDPQGIAERYGERIYSRLFSKKSAKYLIPKEFKDIRK